MEAVRSWTNFWKRIPRTAKTSSQMETVAAAETFESAIRKKIRRVINIDLEPTNDLSVSIQCHGSLKSRSRPSEPHHLGMIGIKMRHATDKYFRLLAHNRALLLVDRATLGNDEHASERDTGGKGTFYRGEIKDFSFWYSKP